MRDFCNATFVARNYEVKNYVTVNDICMPYYATYSVATSPYRLYYHRPYMNAIVNNIIAQEALRRHN